MSIVVAVVMGLAAIFAGVHVAFYPFISTAMRKEWLLVVLLIPVIGGALWFAFAQIRTAQFQDLLEELIDSETIRKS
ncbi:hypothetical protein ABCS02_33390 [Microbacterium sp. X-17]|uniref:hypothetical protein n=1 Tax=Microbacterium sp. X-17 TaxID=3144404 RepID=UPI0031F596BB